MRGKRSSARGVISEHESTRQFGVSPAQRKEDPRKGYGHQRKWACRERKSSTSLVLSAGFPDGNRLESAKGAEQKLTTLQKKNGRSRGGGGKGGCPLRCCGGKSENTPICSAEALQETDVGVGELRTCRTFQRGYRAGFPQSVLGSTKKERRC